MTYFEGCQIPGYQRIAEGDVEDNSPSPVKRFKRTFAKPWNYMVKPRLKRIIKRIYAWRNGQNKPVRSSMNATPIPPADRLKEGDVVRVRDRAEIEATLDPFKELKGCAFLDDMWQYCGTTQHVLKPVERFLDERDYKVKKAKGVILLDGIMCTGTPVFGRCDRSCHLFWREEWLAKIPNQQEIIEASI